MNKIKNVLGGLAGMLLLAVAAKAQTPNFKVVPEFPKELDTIQISYDARSTILKDAQEITGNLTGFQDFQWVYNSIKFVKKDTVWTATYVLPPKMSLMNFVFQSDTLQDKGGDQTYSYILTANDGRQMSGGMLGWGLLRTPHIVRGVPFVVDTTSYKTDQILMMWVKYELQYHPENRFKVLYAASSALKHMNTAESLSKLQNELHALQQFADLKEEDWIAIFNVYKEVLQDTAKSTEIENKIRTSFPDGTLVRNEQRLMDFKKINEAKDDTTRLKAATDFIDRHPYQESNKAFDEANRISYVSAYWIISAYTSMQKDLAAYTKYVSTASPYMALSNVIYRTLSVPFVSQNSMTAQEILPYTRVVLDRLNYYKDNFQGDEYTTLYYGNASLFAKILTENKLFDEAFVYAAAARSVKGYEDADLNDTYARILHAQTKTKALKGDLEASYKANQCSPYMLDLLKALYLAENGSDKGYDAYLVSLKDTNKQSELAAKVQRLLTSKDVPGFQLRDQFGNTVSLTQQKGKTVILDFWASWCAPCKAAFPGMKLAVEHFKNDPNVVFYFIDTQEKRADAKEYVTNYVKDNDYPFTVLLDGDSKVSKSFGVGPIPHKIVIGPNGKIRFSEVGYMGSASELADEIIAMVNLLKTTK